MRAQSTREDSAGPRKRPIKLAFAEILIVLGGIALGQAVLYGPSLFGQTILLPLDILAGPGVYIPRTPEVSKIEISDQLLGDWIYMAEPSRRFAVSELGAARLPMGAPSQFPGGPVV